MEAKPDSPHVVGRPAAVRALLQEVMESHRDEVMSWAMSAPEPEVRAREFQKELGRRRRGRVMQSFALCQSTASRRLPVPPVAGRLPR